MADTRTLGYPQLRFRERGDSFSTIGGRTRSTLAISKASHVLRVFAARCELACEDRCDRPWAFSGSGGVAIITPDTAISIIQLVE